MRARIRWLIAFCFLMGSLTTAATAQDGLVRITQAKVLKVGVALNAPWVIKKADGTFTGYDIDLFDALAQDLGVRPQYVEIPFADLVSTVARGDVDIAGSGLAITPERARLAAFSTSTGVQEIATVYDRTAMGNDPAAAISKGGFRIAVLAKSTDEAAARRAFPKAIVVPYPSAADALAALIDGKTQAMVATEPVPRVIASLYDAKLRMLGSPLQRTAEAFAVAPGDMRFLTYVNNWITARMTDGFMANVALHWFEGNAWLAQLGGNDRRRSASRPRAAAAR